MREGGPGPSVAALFLLGAPMIVGAVLLVAWIERLDRYPRAAPLAGGRRPGATQAAPSR